MIVSCERCATQFHLDDAKVPEEGVRVRCSKCEHSFFVQSPAGDGLAADALARAAFLGDGAAAARDPLDDTLDLDGDSGDVESGDVESDWKFNDDSAMESSSPPRGSGSTSDAASQAVDDLLAFGGSATSPDLEIGAPGGADPGLEFDDGPAFELDASGGDLSGDDSPFGEPPPAAQPNLGEPEEWDFFDAETTSYAEVPTEAGTAARSEGSGAQAVGPAVASPPVVAEPAKVSTWRARVASGAGWSVVAVLGTLAVLGGIATRTPDVGVVGAWSGDRYSADAVRGRWIENAAGPIYVVSGRIRREAGPASTRPIVRLLGASGAAVGEAGYPLGPPLSEQALRESDPEALIARQLGRAASFASLAQDWQPFEAVIGELPDEAVRFELGESVGLGGARTPTGS